MIRREELARFLRSRRERLDPAVLGIEAGGRRRTAGLRREEVADAAGISATWYVWLEQGRDVNASPHALRALGRALRLSQSEQTYLFRLARPDLDWRNGPLGEAMPAASLLSLIDGLSPHPAYITNRYRQVVAANRPARLLLGAFDSGDPVRGSVIGRMFLDPLWREIFVDWQTVARSTVAQYRLATASMADDPVLASLVALLTASSDEFAAWWADRELAEPPIWRKTVRHGLVGDMAFDFAVLQPHGRDSDFSVCLYAPADAASRERMDRLSKTNAAVRLRHPPGATSFSKAARSTPPSQ
jgi:transcriptional regulator with XRE-family HTH domain